MNVASARAAAARRPRRCRAPGPARRPGRTGRRRRAATATARSSQPAHRRTAAASADPPPRPPPAGIRLSTCTAARAPDSRERPGDEVRVVGGHAGARTGRSTVEPVARRIDRQLVGEVERHHLGVDQVVAVVAHAGDRAATASAWPGAMRRRSRRDRSSARRAGPTRRRRAPRPGPSASMPAAANAAASTHPGERPAQHLAPLAERRPGRARTARPGRRRPARRVGGRSRRAPTRPSAGAGTPSAGTRPTSRAVAQYATFTLTAP